MNELSDPNDDPIGALLRRAAADEAPPPAVRARAVALRGGLAGAARALLRRVVALAVPDGGGSTFAPAFGVRGGGVPSGRQWLFRADECEIDLRVTPRGERWSVAGQVFGALQAERVELAGAEHQAHAPLGATREFGFDDLPAGRYSLTLQGGEVEVVIPQFDIGAGADPA